MSDDAAIPDRPDDDVLAAEYVLGVLDLEARQRLANRIDQDAAFARLVSQWEERLAGLNRDFAAVAPPAAVKAAIDQRLFDAARAPQPPARTSLWSSLGFWRALAGLALAGLVALAVVTYQARQAPPAGETLVAALSAEDSDARFVAVYDSADNRLRVTTVAGTKPADRDFELWLIAGERAPVSLGLVGATGERAPQVAADLRPLFAAGATLAVSLEPQGGSTTGAPTGPVVAAGPVTKI
jgi:anti-sigma-K factor RskA